MSKLPWFSECCAELQPIQAGLGNRSDANSITGWAKQYFANLWNIGDTITYAFYADGRQNAGTTNQQNKVISVLSNWIPADANVVVQQTTTDKALVRITFDPTQGNWALVGKPAYTSATDTTKPTMNFAGLTDNANQIYSGEGGIVLHNALHMLGMVHEYPGPDLLPLDPNAAIIYYTEALGWTQDQVQDLLAFYKQGFVTNGLIRDPFSVMQSPMPSIMNYPRVAIHQPDSLTQKDSGWLAVLYPTATMMQPGKVLLTSYLNTLGVSADVQKTIISATDPTGVRSAYVSWFVTQLATNAPTIPPPILPPPPSRPDSPTPGGNQGPPHVKQHGIEWCMSELDDVLSTSSTSADTLGRTVSASSVDRVIAIENNLLWQPGYQIKYLYQQTNAADGSVTYDYRRGRLEDTFKYFSSIANIEFVQVTDETDYPDVRIWFNDDASTYQNWCIRGIRSRGYSNPATTSTTTSPPAGRNGGLANTTCFFSTPATPLTGDGIGFEDRAWESLRYFHQVGHMLGLIHSWGSIIETLPVQACVRDKSIMDYPGVVEKSGQGEERIVAFQAVPTDRDRAMLAAMYPPPPSDHSSDFETAVTSLIGGGAMVETLGKIMETYNKTNTIAGQPGRFSMFAELRNQVVKSILKADGVL